MKTRTEHKEIPLLKIHVESNATVVTPPTLRQTSSTTTTDHNSQSQTQKDTSSSTSDREITSTKPRLSEGTTALI
jgi:hypothetical protein